MSGLISDFLPIIYLFSFIGFGFLAQYVFRGYSWFSRGVGFLSKFVYYVLVPVVFFDVFMVRGLGIADVGVLATTTLYVLVSVAVLLYLLRGRDSSIRYGVVITSTFQNAVFLGFPVIMLIYGDLTPAAMYSLTLFIYHLLVAGLLASGRSSITRSLLNLPILYGFLLGSIAHYTLPSSTISSLHFVLEPSHPLLSYTAVFVLGATIPFNIGLIHGYRWEVLLIGAWRFIASPIIHYAILLLLELPPLYEAEIMVLSVMPPAVMNTVLARIYGWKPELVAGATLVHTLISLFIIIGLAILL